MAISIEQTKQTRWKIIRVSLLGIISAISANSLLYLVFSALGAGSRRAGRESSMGAGLWPWACQGPARTFHWVRRETSQVPAAARKATEAPGETC